MVKIVKPGTHKGENLKIYTVTCPRCGCVFECEDSDLETKKDEPGKKYIHCPDCDLKLYFNSDPKELKDMD